MSKGRNIRKKRENKKEEYSTLKIAIAIIILILIIGLIVVSIISLNKKNKVKKISYEDTEYEYFVLYGIDNKIGIINKTGNIIIPQKYNEIYIPNEEKDVFFCYGEDGDCIILNSRNEKIFTEFEEVLPLRTSDTAILDFEKGVLKYKENDKYGLVDFEGSKITEPIYQSLSSIENKPGAILAKKDDKFGALDSKGNIVIDFKYDNISGDGYYSQIDGYEKTGYITKIKTNDGDEFGYIDYNGKELLDNKYESLERVLEYEDNNVFIICMNRGKKGVFKNKKKIISMNFQNIYYSDNSNIFIVQKANKYGFYNNKGRKILDADYEKYSLAGNYISVERNGNTTLYDINGNTLNNINYVSMIETENPEYFIAQKENGNFCIINKSIIVDEDFYYLTYAFDNYFIFMNREGKYGVWKVWEGIVVEPDYEYILKVDGKEALEAKQQDSEITDIYSKDMEKVLSMDGAILDSVDETYFVVYSNSEKVYLNKDGKIVKNSEVYPDNSIYSIQKDGRWGFVDKNGVEIIPCKYDFVTELNEYGFAAIATKGVWGVIDKTGKTVVEPSYELEVYYMPKFVGKYKLEELESVYCIEIQE